MNRISPKCTFIMNYFDHSPIDINNHIPSINKIDRSLIINELTTQKKQLYKKITQSNIDRLSKYNNSEYLTIVGVDCFYPFGRSIYNKDKDNCNDIKEPLIFSFIK
jgi:hypothetical protein